ncbi:hypothetical protein QJF78_000481 [Vibrio cholerae]|nr:hypothetical protein [Vibrio cholerae]
MQKTIKVDGMRKVTNTTWDGLPFHDFRNRFFVEVWKEILYVNTPSFYQSKTMNVMSGAEEIIEAVDDYLVDEKNGNFLLTILSDYKNVLKSDNIARILFTNLHPLLINKTDLNKESLSNHRAMEIKTIVSLVLNKEDEYYNELKKQLKASVLSAVDLTKKARVMEEIYKLTKMYIGHLLWKGYSPTYLYNRMEYLTRITNYGSRDFSAQLNSCLDKLTVRVSDYNVYFLVAPLSKYLIETKNILGVEFVDRKQFITDDNYKKISQGFESSVVAKVVVNTTDYVSAAWQANEILDKAIDFLGIEKPQYNFKYSPVCLTEFNSGAHVHKQTINIGRLKQFITSKDTGALESIPQSIKFSFRESIKLERYDVLTRSLRYLRVAKESTSLEQKLLSLWIALECIFESTEGNIISGITNYVPLFYSSQSLDIRLNYAKSLLETRLVYLPTSWKNLVKNNESKFNQLSLTEFFDIMKIEKNRHSVYSDLTKLGEEFVVFRVIHIFDCFKSSAACEKRITDTKVDVEKQLHRIYKVRNKLTHRAFYGHVRPQLVDNLLGYLLSAYNTLILGCIYDDIPDFKSQDLFNVYKSAYGAMIHNMKGTKKDLPQIKHHDFIVTEQF